MRPAEVDALSCQVHTIGVDSTGSFGATYLVHAVTEGPPDERLYGNFPAYQRHPPVYAPPM